MVLADWVRIPCHGSGLAFNGVWHRMEQPNPHRRRTAVSDREGAVFRFEVSLGCSALLLLEVNHTHRHNH